MILTFKNGAFIVAQCSFDERHEPRDAKFRFGLQGTKKRWYTSQHSVAARLRQYADDDAKKELNRLLIHVEPWAGSIPFPLGLEPLPFQLPTTQWLLSRNRGYLAAKPGLGKGVMAVLASNALYKSDHDWHFIYLCPPFLTRTVREEFIKWARFPEQTQLMIVPDSMVWREKTINQIAAFMKRGRQKFCLFIDEAHRFKDDESQRGKALYGQAIETHTYLDDAGQPVSDNIAAAFQFTKTLTKVHWQPGLLSKCDRSYFLSGTPMPNRPMELYPLLHHAAPEAIKHMNRFQFGERYCAGFRTQYGWDFNGESNMDELTKRVREKFMLVINKEDVLDLPSKLEEFIFLSYDMSPALGKMNKGVLAAHSKEDIVEGRIKEKIEMPDGQELHKATYRKLLGKEKVPGAVEVISNALQDNGEAILVFAHHKDVVAALAANLRKFKPFVIDGSVPMATRHDLVARFQKGETKLFILEYTTAVGLTLTAATECYFVEFDWVPGINEQAGDRVHRIGQEWPVAFKYFIFRDSFDRVVMESNFKKKKAIDTLTKTQKGKV